MEGGSIPPLQATAAGATAARPPPPALPRRRAAAAPAGAGARVATGRDLPPPTRHASCRLSTNQRPLLGSVRVRQPRSGGGGLAQLPLEAPRRINRRCSMKKTLQSAAFLLFFWVRHRGGHGTLLDATGTRGRLPPRVADHTPAPAGWCATATAACAMRCPVDRWRRRGSCLALLVAQLPLAPVRPVLGRFLPCLVDVLTFVSLAVPVSTVSANQRSEVATKRPRRAGFPRGRAHRALRCARAPLRHTSKRVRPVQSRPLPLDRLPNRATGRRRPRPAQRLLGALATRGYGREHVQRQRVSVRGHFHRRVLRSSALVWPGAVGGVRRAVGEGGSGFFRRTACDVGLPHMSAVES